MSDLIATVKVTSATHAGGTGYAELNISNGTPPFTVEWRKIDADGNRTTVFMQYFLFRNAPVGNYEVVLTSITDPKQTLTVPFTVDCYPTTGFNVSLGRVTGYGKADGSIIGQIYGGTAPYSADIKVNGNIFRNLDGIPASTPENPNNLQVRDLPPGKYTIWVEDSGCENHPSSKAGGDTTFCVLAPPFVTLNGTVNPGMNIETTVSFEFGLDTNYGNEVQGGKLNGIGDHPVSIQLDSTNLSSGTTYHYRIKATNSQSPMPVYGEDKIFTTPAVLPVVHTLDATNIS